MIVDLLTCAHPHRSGLFDFVTDIAYSAEVMEWFNSRIEETVVQINQTCHVPVLYVVHQDWVIFSKLFDLTPETGMILGVCSGLRFQVSLYCVFMEFISLPSTLVLISDNLFFIC